MRGGLDLALLGLAFAFGPSNRIAEAGPALAVRRDPELMGRGARQGSGDGGRLPNQNPGTKAKRRWKRLRRMRG